MAVKSSVFLGIEGGGTRTMALLGDAHGQILNRLELDPLNLKLASDAQILSALRHIRRAPTFHSSLFTLHALSVCLAGCRTAADRARVRVLAVRVWPRTRCFIGNDLDSGFAAAFGPSRDGILVVSGTGSCVYGRHGVHTIQVGGWGHLLGDHGSGYWIAQRTLQAALREFDRTGRSNATLRKVLRARCFNSANQLIDWMQRAGKAEVAALATEIGSDNRAVLMEAARQLAADCSTVAKKLHLLYPSIVLTGGVLAHHRGFRQLLATEIRRRLPHTRIGQPQYESAHGTLLLAIAHGAGGCFDKLSTSSAPSNSAGGRGSSRIAQHRHGLSITEQRNPRTMDLHRQTVPQLIDTMLAEESRVVPTIRQQKTAIARAIRAIVAAFKRGGRLFYVGAGTSGRLGVLDASECPPTFSTPPDMVQGIIAGGVNALYSAVEVAEDDAGAGAEAVRFRNVGRRDVVVGITASGSTPFVLGALDEAKRRGARTFLLCFSTPLTTHHSPLTIPTGPEVLTGSTRLKAGTATKLVLNMLTTISMIRLGKAVSNLMVYVKPNSEKLRARAFRIVATLRSCSEAEARRRLQRANWRVKSALR
jgi:N-acetylmuramic acid 6-phosphate etherase